MERWNVPEGWEITPVGKLVRIKSGFACAKKNRVSPEEGIAHLRPFNIDTKGQIDLSEVYYIPTDYKDNVEEYTLEPGDVLFNNTNSVELVGKSALVTEPMACAFSNHIYRLTVKPKAAERLGPAWLALALQHLWMVGYFAEYCNRWIGQAGFNSSKLRDTEIPLPPLDVQRRLVARIETLLAEVDTARRLHETIQEEMERLVDTALAEVFESTGKYPEKQLCELVTIEAQLVDPTLPEFKDLPHISGSVIESGTGQLGKYHTAAEDGMISGKYHFMPGSVLYSKIRPYLRKATLVNFKGLCSADMYPLRVQDGALLAEYLQWALLSHHFTAYASELSGRARMPKLNREQLFSYRLHLPPLPEQRRIVAYLDEVQAHVAGLRAAAAALAIDLERTEQAILARAFRGEL